MERPSAGGGKRGRNLEARKNTQHAEERSGYKSRLVDKIRADCRAPCALAVMFTEPGEPPARSGIDKVRANDVTYFNVSSLNVISFALWGRQGLGGGKREAR